MSGTVINSYLVFTVNGRYFALPTCFVVRVTAAAELLVVPDAPSSMLGVVNLGGEPVPVMDLCWKLGSPFREMELSDRFVFVRTGEKTVAFIAESVEGVSVLAPGAISLSFLSHSPIEEGENERNIVVAYTNGGEKAILLRTPETLLSMTGADFEDIENAVSLAGDVF